MYKSTVKHRKERCEDVRSGVFSAVQAGRRGVLGGLALGCLAWCAGSAEADITNTKPLHHFFNAALLKPGEVQVSLLTNARLGVTDELELGTNGILDGMGFYNVALKHRMFIGEDFWTSFTSHSFYTTTLSRLSSQDQDSAFFSLHGVMTTHRLSDQLFLNWGPMDFMIYIRSATSFAMQTVHLPTAVLGTDYILSRNFALTALVLKPVYRTATLESDDLELTSKSDLLRDPSQVPAIGMLSLVFSYRVFNIELNGLLVGHTPFGYLNMWWRWP